MARRPPLGGWREPECQCPVGAEPKCVNAGCSRRLPVQHYPHVFYSTEADDFFEHGSRRAMGFIFWRNHIDEVRVGRVKRREWEVNQIGAPAEAAQQPSHGTLVVERCGSDVTLLVRCPDYYAAIALYEQIIKSAHEGRLRLDYTFKKPVV